jgi:hypothetical protein
MAADGSFVWSFRNLGEYFIQVERWSEAVDVLSQASQIQPPRPSVLRSLSKAELGLAKEQAVLGFFDSWLHGDGSGIDLFLSPEGRRWARVVCAEQSTGSCMTAMYQQHELLNPSFVARAALQRVARSGLVSHRLKSSWSISGGVVGSYCQGIGLELVGAEWKVRYFTPDVQRCV